MKRLLLLFACLILGACAGNPPLPQEVPPLQLPMTLHVQREQAGQSQDWLLVIQREDQRLRWSLMDLLGIPQARQLLADGQWQADGLLPPNPAARELFAALLFALTPTQRLTALYPAAQQQDNRRWLGERWQVSYRQADEFTLNLQQGLRYQVTPLPGENPP